jgi:hypothetical protein
MLKLQRLSQTGTLVLLATACGAAGPPVAASTPAQTTAPGAVRDEHAALAQNGSGPAAAPCCEDLRAFYERFRAAALATDVEQAANLTRFPLEVRGALDDSPSLRVTRNQFAHYFPALLDADIEESEPPISARQSFGEAVAPDPKWIADESFRVANFQFEKGADGWRLAVVYSDTVANKSDTQQDRKR